MEKSGISVTLGVRRILGAVGRGAKKIRGV